MVFFVKESFILKQKIHQNLGQASKLRMYYIGQPYIQEVQCQKQSYQSIDKFRFAINIELGFHYYTGRLRQQGLSVQDIVDILLIVLTIPYDIEPKIRPLLNPNLIVIVQSGSLVRLVARQLLLSKYIAGKVYNKTIDKVSPTINIESFALVEVREVREIPEYILDIRPKRPKC